MPGMSRISGALIETLPHIRQSVGDILTTPIGSRVGRRDYGSRLPDLIDAPLTPALRVDIAAETIDALAKWEPRLSVRRVMTTLTDVGRIVLDIEVTHEGQALTLDEVLL